MTTETSLYEEVLEAAQGSLPPHRQPRDSASVVLWRRREKRREVFWVRRSERVRFMPGWHAFPGGSVHRADAEVPASGSVVGGSEDESSLPDHLLLPGDDPGPDLSRPIGVAALRELWEEAGIAITTRPLDPDDLERVRNDLLEAPGRLAGRLDELGTEIDLSRLIFAGRWLTPPFAPLRFDNRFFLLEWQEGDPEPEVRGGELAGGEWIEPRLGLERWERAELLAAPPILHVLKVLHEEGLGEKALERLLDPREADLGPFRRIEFRPGIVMLPLRTPTLPPATHTNAYLVGRERVILVDPGSPFPEEQERLHAAVRAHLAQGRELHAIWLTHHHPDHVGGVNAAREAFDVPVAAHRSTAEILVRRGIPVDKLLAEGETAELGGLRVTAYRTPGHANGHLCFYVHEHRSLLAGDLVSALSTIVIDPPENRMGRYLDSLRRMAELEPAALFPAHGPVLAPGEDALYRVIRHREAREQRILDAWNDGHRTPAAIRPQAYDDIPEMLHPLAERQIEAHLVHLEERGEVERS